MPPKFNEKGERVYKDGLTESDLVEIGHRAAELTRQDILEQLEQEGVTVQQVARILNEASQATTIKQQYVPPTTITVGPRGDKETIVIDEGGWKEARPLIDHASRLAAAKQAKDILGLDAPKRMDATVNHRYLLPETEELVNKITSRNVTQVVNTTSVLITNRRVVSFKEFDETPIIDLVA
jgi:hypothetical protein